MEFFNPWPQITRSAVSLLKIDAGHAVPSWVAGLVRLRSQLVDESVLVCNNQTLCWELEAVKLHIICLKKNSRSVCPSAVTVKSKKIIGLISDDRNLKEVKEKLIHVDNAFQRLREAHHDYSSEIMDEDGIAKYEPYLKSEEKEFGLFRQQIDDNCIWGDSVVKPEDSISFASASEPSKASRAFNASKLSKLSVE